MKVSCHMLYIKSMPHVCLSFRILLIKATNKNYFKLWSVVAKGLMVKDAEEVVAKMVMQEYGGKLASKILYIIEWMCHSTFYG